MADRLNNSEFEDELGTYQQGEYDEDRLLSNDIGEGDNISELVESTFDGDESLEPFGEVDPEMYKPGSAPSKKQLEEAAQKLGIKMKCSHCIRSHKTGEPEEMVVCSGCGTKNVFHHKCWDEDHAGSEEEDLEEASAHEKTNMQDYIWIKFLLSTDIPPNELKNLHQKDVWTKWFGVPPKVPKHAKMPQLISYPRVESLLSIHGFRRSVPSTQPIISKPAASTSSASDAISSPSPGIDNSTTIKAASDTPVYTIAKQFPSIVSFFGETGGGKSTLIRALIRSAAPGTISFQTPVSAAKGHINISTSGDVHLYADPQTISTDFPMMYADCEGLGGSTETVASQACQTTQENKTAKIAAKTTAVVANGVKRTISISRRSKKRNATNSELHNDTTTKQFDIKWAEPKIESSGRRRSMFKLQTSDQKPGERPQITDASKTLVVNKLYPRILYTFSDAVCYITRNLRESEKVIQTLFDWASGGHERTINQPIKPGLILIGNKLPTSEFDEKWLDVDFAKQKVLEGLQSAAAFKRLQTDWEQKGISIDTAEDLILRYYSTFHVICIPDLPEGKHGPSVKYTRIIKSQYEILYHRIRSISESQGGKKDANKRLLDVEIFNAYLQHAFQTLSASLQNSIDFYEYSKLDVAAPSEFNEHLSSVVMKMLNNGGYDTSVETGQEAKLLSHITPYLAWCIVTQIKASGKHLDQRLIKNYLRQVRDALIQCEKKHWRCEEKSSRTGARCRNRRNGHDKGHQFEIDCSGEGPDIEPEQSPGDFQFSMDKERLLQSLEEQINEVAELDVPNYQLGLGQNGKSSGVSEVMSNRTCIVCLANSPVYILPCEETQHRVCEECAERFNDTKQRSGVITLGRCPLGCKLSVSGSPWSIRRKPAAAGVRVLSLDGGGIRGVIELSILQRVVQEVGHGIPIQELFDLVLGTSTGGVIALGLFKAEWSPAEASEKFVELCHKAFNPRTFLKIPGFRNSAQLFYSYRYETDGIETALRDAFGRGPLFGHETRTQTRGDLVKIGVVAAMQGISAPYLFANYSRNQQKPDYLQRPDGPEDEFLTWQAARATSAAPIYFKPYYHLRNKKSYVDGAIVHNNPVALANSERKRIWKETDGKGKTDIILSVGTGVHYLPPQTDGNVPRDIPIQKKKLLPGGWKQKLITSYDVVMSTLNCEDAWTAFVNSTKGDFDPNILHRLNVQLDSKPPKLDQVPKIPILQKHISSFFDEKQSAKAQKHYQFHESYKSGQEHIKAVAQRLTASLFYFEEDKLSLQLPVTDGVRRSPRICKGHLCCRLGPGMYSQLTSLMSKEPGFRVNEQDGPKVNIPGPLHFKQDTFSANIEFPVTGDSWKIEVSFPNWQTKNYWEAISGFS